LTARPFTVGFWVLRHSREPVLDCEATMHAGPSSRVACLTRYSPIGVARLRCIRAPMLLFRSRLPDRQPQFVGCCIIAGRGLKGLFNSLDKKSRRTLEQPPTWSARKRNFMWRIIGIAILLLFLVVAVGCSGAPASGVKTGTRGVDLTPALPAQSLYFQRARPSHSAASPARDLPRIELRYLRRQAWAACSQIS